MVNEPIHVTDAAFEKVVLQSDLPVIVDFSAEWCGPCKMIDPVLEKIAAEHAGRLIVARVDADQNQRYMLEYDVRGIPTLLFIANGKVIHRQVGAVPETFLRDIVEEFLKIVGPPKVH